MSKNFGVHPHAPVIQHDCMPPPLVQLGWQRRRLECRTIEQNRSLYVKRAGKGDVARGYALKKNQNDLRAAIEARKIKGSNVFENN